MLLLLLFRYVESIIVLCNGGDIDVVESNDESLLHKRGLFSSDFDR